MTEQEPTEETPKGNDAQAILGLLAVIAAIAFAIFVFA